MEREQMINEIIRLTLNYTEEELHAFCDKLEAILHLKKDSGET
ncbi:hypothetical protein ACQ5SP_06660 [Rhodovulum sp. YNF3179]